MALGARTVVDKLGLVVATLASAFLVATIGEPLRMNWGDPWTDCNALVTGRFFSKYGFFKTAFTPIIDIEPLSPDSLRYTHYPPLPDLINGVQQEIHGEADLSVFRVPAIAMSLFALLLLFRFVERLWGSAVASVSIAFFAGNFLWLQYADTINHIPLYWGTGFGALLCAARWTTERRARDLILVGVLTFACFLSSYDFVFFVPLMVVATPLVLGEKLWTSHVRKLVIIAGIGGALAITVKNLLVIWAVGWPQFYGDFIFQFHERATSQYSADYKSGFGQIFAMRLWRCFTPLFFVVVAVQVAVVAIKLARRDTAKSSASPLFLLGAGMPFIVVFSQLFCDQYHPTLLLLPYYAVSAGLLVVRLAESPSAARRAAALAFVVVGLGWQANEVATFPKTFVSRSDVARVRTVLEQDHQRFVFSNGVAVAPFLYFWNRYDLSVSYIPPEQIPRYATDLQDQFGAEPIRYIHFARIEKSVYDKYLYAYFAPGKHFDWIADPARHVAEWEPGVRARDEALVSHIAKFSHLELDTGTMRVFKISRQSIDDFFAKEVMAAPTTFIDFGGSSEAYKAYGIRYSEKSGDSGFAWTSRRQPGRYVSTLKGLVVVATAPPRDDAGIRLNLPPGKRYRISLSLASAVNGQLVAVSINDTPKLTELSLDTGDARELVVDVPPAALAPSGLQVLRLQMGRANEGGLGVALRTLRVTSE